MYQTGRIFRDVCNLQTMHAITPLLFPHVSFARILPIFTFPISLHLFPLTSHLTLRNALQVIFKHRISLIIYTCLLNMSNFLSNQHYILSLPLPDNFNTPSASLNKRAVRVK